MAAAPLSFPPFDPDIEPHTVGSRWEKWLDRFENYLVAMDITDGKRQKALLLHFAKRQDGGQRVGRDFYCSQFMEILPH